VNEKRITYFFTALMCFIRDSVSQNINHNPDYLNKASLFSAYWLDCWDICLAAFYLFYFFWHRNSSSLSMIVSISTTGAFHEDGFADVCDGFGGGWTKDKILLIMKDSAIKLMEP
jgi:adenosylcobinamide-GDP ribazoletransferase